MWVGQDSLPEQFPIEQGLKRLNLGLVFLPKNRLPEQFPIEQGLKQVSNIILVAYTDKIFQSNFQ